MINQKDCESYLYDISLGNMDSLEKLYNETRKAIFAYALSITNNVSDAEDVLQTTFINVINSVHTYKPMGKPLAWMFTIAKNLAIKSCKEKNNEVDIQWETLIEPSDNLSFGDKQLLYYALNQLQTDEKQIVMLYTFSGFKFLEIATFLNYPLSTVLSKYYRSMKKLKTYMKEEITCLTT